LSRPHWIKIASTSSLVQLEVRTGAEGTSTTGSCFGAAGSCDPDVGEVEAHTAEEGFVSQS